jgi:large subunit ribosomal protein L15
MKEKEVDLSTLKKHGIVKQKTTAVKVILSGEIKNAVMLKGIKVTKGARQVIESAGGKIED